METKITPEIRIIRNEDVEVLANATPIAITATAATEGRNGKSVIRFVFRGEKSYPRKMFRKFSPWHKLQQGFSVKVGDELIDRCSLRECSFDPEAETLYLSIYTPEPAEKILDWF